MSFIEFANNWIPIGNPLTILNGIEIAGFPVKLAVTVLISTKNIEYSKIFFDLDEQEIRKLFVYFDKQAYFDNHKYDIIYEFKKYTEENRRLINVH